MVRDDSRWKRISLGGAAELRVPVDMRATEGQGVDSTVSAWENDELSISVDTGPFVDRLQRAAEGADVVEHPVSGRVVRTTSFVDTEGSAVAVAHVPEATGDGSAPGAPAMTVVVRGKPGRAPDLPAEVIRSLSIGGSGS
jgi:hypothetical protein